MNSLLACFIVICVLSLAFAIWLSTKSGKKWLNNLK